MRNRAYWVLLFAVAVLCLAVYQFPYALEAASHGFTRLPPFFEFDQMLYLNLSSVRHGSATEIMNPWYGDSVLVKDVPHLQFGLAFRMFGAVHHLVGGWLSSVMVWNACWTLMSLATALFCLRQMFPNSKPELWILMAMGLLVLRSPLTYLSVATQVLKHKNYFDITLPYLRFAFPQVVVPVVLVYWGLQVATIRNWVWRYLAGMAVFQWIAFMVFPYVIPLLALGTAITFAIAILRPGDSGARFPVSRVAAFAAACAALDLGYILMVGFGGSHGNVRFDLHFNRAMLIPSLRPYMLLLLLAAGLALMSKASFAARTTVAGLAISNAILGLSDVAFPFDAQMVTHINYIVDLTTVLTLLVFLWSFLERAYRPVLRTSLLILLALLGFWAGYSNYCGFRDLNAYEAASEAALEKVSLTSSDLVIAPSQTADDVSSWVPLISDAGVLFTIDAENMLPADRVHSEQTFRQATYLEMGGFGIPELLFSTAEGSLDSQVNALTQHGERGYLRSPLPEHRAEARAVVRARLQPVLEQIENDPESIRHLLSSYRRLVVVDHTEHPVFPRSALNNWVEVLDQYEQGGVTVLICRSRSG